ncbi:hypothetical protein SAMN05421858_3251 [Haladaptatus litoreus]|uniref:Uncharacterized protein n=1 Tax=Haladaptatus litoreus TaxID=553468 RepID=A0A1N7CTX1_9EURY|nr:hypothetical protein SAMN05421858_3251 [Haladaptatus litoreus]
MTNDHNWNLDQHYLFGAEANISTPAMKSTISYHHKKAVRLT